MKRPDLGRQLAIALCLAPFVAWGERIPGYSLDEDWAKPLAELAVSPNTCPVEVETLTRLMLQDLPSYANRILRRSRILDDPDDDFSSTVIIAGNPEFEPLPLSPIDTSQVDPLSRPNPTHQIFFTTLTRNYSSGKTYNTQNYYWMFLVQTESGWRLFSLLSSFGTSVDGHSPSPPRESVNGVMGQAVKRWLRDCRAGAI